MEYGKGHPASRDFIEPESYDLSSSGLRDLARGLNNFSIGAQTASSLPGAALNSPRPFHEQSYHPHLSNDHVNSTISSDHHFPKMLMPNPLEHDPNLNRAGFQKSRSHDSPLGEEITMAAVSHHMDQTPRLDFRLIQNARFTIDPYDVPYSLPGKISNELKRQLDHGGQWKKLIKSMDHTRYEMRIDEILSLEQKAQIESPTFKLMHRFSGLCMTNREFARFLDAAKLYAPLELLREPEPVLIVKHPESRSVEEGESLVLTCEAIGFPVPEYDWYFFNETEGGAPRKLFCNHSTLRIPCAGLSHKGHYSCVARRPGDQMSVKSEWCMVQISPSPKLRKPIPKRRSELKIIDETPWAQRTVLPGTTVELKCHAFGHPTPSYKWYKDCKEITGCYQPTFTMLHASKRDSGTYFCVIHNDFTQIRSRHFKLTVNEDGPFREKAPSEVPPSFEHGEVHYAVSKVALLIGMKSYQGHRELPAAENDVIDLEKLLQEMGFMTVSLLNLTKKKMLHHINWFCGLLAEGVYGVFYFIGHGFEYLGQSFLIPMEVKQPFKLKDCVSLQKDVMLPILNKDPKLCMALIDMCRVPPNEMEKEDIPERVVLPRNGKTLRLFAASDGHQSYEDEKTKKSYFMQYLSTVITEPISVTQLHQRVSSAIEKDQFAGKFQYPEMETNLIEAYSLFDPIIYEGHTAVMNRSRQLWESVTRLPKDQVLAPCNGFIVSISSRKHVSNEIFIVATIQEKGEATDYKLSLTDVPEGLTSRLVKPRRNKCLVEFLIIGLENLTDDLLPILKIEIKIGGTLGTFSRKLNLGRPLVSYLVLGMKNEELKEKKEKLPTQQEEPCHSGAHR